MKKDSSHILNKNENVIEQSIGMTLKKYKFEDIKFDKGDITVNFNMDIIETIIDNQESQTVKYTNRSNVYTDVGFVGEAMENTVWYPSLDETVSIFGLDTLENKFGFIVDTIVGAIKSRLPGTGSPIHIDRYSKVKSVSGNTGRWVIHLQDWNWGEFCQVDNRIMAGWQAGDSYQVPAGVPHLAVNYGIRNRNFFTVTGELKNG
jgi:hypothetical protein